MVDRVELDQSEALSLIVKWPLWVGAYVALDYVSYIDAYRGLAITPWNPAAGLAFALVVLGGLRYAPVVLVSPILAGILVRGGSVPLPVHFAEGLLFGGSYLLGGMLTRHFGNLDPRLPAPGHVIALMFFLLCTSALAALSCVLVLTSAYVLGTSEVPEAFLRFFVGDLIGMLIVAPAVLMSFTRQRWLHLGWEAAPQFVAIVLAFAAIFAIPHAREYQLFYVLFLPLLWCSFRSGLAGATAALCVIQVGVMLAEQIRHDTGTDLVSFQMLMISLAATGLVFGSLVDQQQAASLRLRQQQLALGRALRLRSMGEVATAIAHEVNQPITSIRTYAGIVRDALERNEPAGATEAAGRIRAECDRATSIIRATRDIVRQEVAQPRQVEVEEILEEVRELLIDRLSRTPIVSRIEPGAETVLCDPVQIKQAVYNIVDNAIDAVEAGGRPGEVEISVRRTAPDTIEFAVRDTGPGFSSELADLGITPLVSTKPEGTGIGLSIARSVAEAHGGSLAIDREDHHTVVRLRIAYSDSGKARHEHRIAR